MATQTDQNACVGAAVAEAASLAAISTCVHGHRLAGHVLVYLASDGDVEQVCPATVCPTCTPFEVDPTQDPPPVFVTFQSEG